MATKTSYRRAARQTVRRAERALPAGYAHPAWGLPDANGNYATFGLPYPVPAAR